MAKFQKYFGLILFGLITHSDAKEISTMTDKPLEIVDIDDSDKNAVLTTPMQKVAFPLSQEDHQFIKDLGEKVIQEGAAGLAATQVGVAKPITVFHVPEMVLTWREDVTHFMPLTVLINPSYEPIEKKGKTLDWEGCCSGKNHYGKIWRYRAIRYKGFNIEGEAIEGVAEGFLARLLQHEIDHCQGNMCILKYDPDSPKGSQEGLLSTRKEELAKRKTALGLKADGHFPLMPRDESLYQ